MPGLGSAVGGAASRARPERKCSRQSCWAFRDSEGNQGELRRSLALSQIVGCSGQAKHSSILRIVSVHRFGIGDAGEDGC
jgi:hypothetical protein